MAILFHVALLLCLLWLVGSVWRISPGWAIVTLLFWPLAIVPMMNHWGDDELDVRKPFFATLVISVISGWLWFQSLSEIHEEAEEGTRLPVPRAGCIPLVDGCASRSWHSTRKHRCPWRSCPRTFPPGNVVVWMLT